MSGSRIRAGKAEIELGVLDRVSGALNQMEQKLRAFADRTRQVGTQLAAAGLAIKAPFALSMKEFATFEQAMANVKAIVTAAGQPFTGLEEKARELGQTTKFTATDAARAMYFFAQAGFDTEKVLQSIGPALDLAAVGQMDVAEATDILVKLMAGMGVESTELTHGVDVLSKGMSMANTDLRQLGDAFKYLGPTAKAAGMTFEEATAAIMLLSNAGIQADMAGTTLRGMVLALASPTKEAKDILIEMGVATKNNVGDFLQLADIIDQFRASMKGIGSGDNMDTVGRLFDNRQATGAVELISQGGDKLRDTADQLRKSAGTANRMAKIQLDTTQGSFLLMVSAAQELAITVGKTLSTAFRTLLSATQKAAVWLSDFVKQNETLVFSVAALGGFLIAAGGGLLALSFAFSTLGAMIAPITILWGAFMGALTTAISLISGVVTGALALAGAIGVWPAIIVGIIAAFIDWGAIFESLRTGLVNGFFAVFEAIKKTMQGVYDALVGGDLALAGQIAITGLKLAFTSGLEAIVEAFGSSVDTMVEMIGLVYKRIGQTISRLNEMRAGVTGVATMALGAVMGVDARMEAEQMLTDAQDWSQSWNNVDTSKMVEGIKKGLDPSIYSEELQKLMDEAAMKRKQAEQEVVERAGYVQPYGAPGTQGPGVIPPRTMDAVGQFAAVGNFSAALVGQALPNAKKTDKQIADNTKKSADALMTIKDILETNPLLLFQP